jgi:transposase
MEMYFSRLIEHLDSQRRQWRKDTIILLDGAPYHTSAAMMEFYQKHCIPVMFTGPHSYDASPIELFFAAFKSKDINPSKLPMGKQ